MSWEAWLAFVVLETALCLAPGPAVLFVVSQGLRRGPGAALWASGGVLGANAIYFAVSATGLGVLLLASWELFVLVKWLGAAWLIWLGVQALRARPTAVAPGPLPAVQAGRIFRAGLAMKLADPKTILYFGALLPQFIDPAGNVGQQILILGLTSVVIEFAVLAGYGGLAGRVRLIVSRPAVIVWFERTAGSLLVAAGVGLALWRRSEP